MYRLNSSPLYFLEFNELYITIQAFQCTNEKEKRIHLQSFICSGTRKWKKYETNINKKVQLAVDFAIFATQIHSLWY